MNCKFRLPKKNISPIGLSHLVWLAISMTACSQPPLQGGLNFSTVNIATGSEKYNVKAIIWLPPGYSREKKYPLVIYGHGSGQAGTDLNKLFLDGLPAVLKSGYHPPFDCVIICPQRISYGVVPEWLPGILEDASKRFSIDSSRIYLTGTSAGGYMCFGSQLNVSRDLARKFAAICVLSGATQDANQANMDWWAKAHTPIWSIVGEVDQSYVRQNIFLMNALNQQVAGMAKISLRPQVGHGGWKEVYDGTFRENGQNIWDWFSLFARGSGNVGGGRRLQGKRISLNITDKQVFCNNVTKEYGPQPGDTLLVPTGIRSVLLRNFSGEKANPIVVMPADKGWIGGYSSYCMVISHAKYFKVAGFHIDGLNNSDLGLTIGDQASDYEVANCDIQNIISMGLTAKQDPDGSYPGGSWPGFSIRNVSLHDITVRHTGTEGFYIGYTFDKKKPLASPLINVQIYNIRIDSTGWDGLQVSNCQQVKLHDIVINHFGLKNQRTQQSGLLLGGMVTVRDSIYNVSVSNGTGSGLTIFGRGLIKMSKITLTRTSLTPGENAIYINDYVDLGYGLPPLQLNLHNIQVNGSAGSALVVLNDNKTMKPGIISNFSFTNTRFGIVDAVDIMYNAGKKNAP